MQEQEISKPFLLPSGIAATVTKMRGADKREFLKKSGRNKILIERTDSLGNGKLEKDLVNKILLRDRSKLMYEIRQFTYEDEFGKRPEELYFDYEFVKHKNRVAKLQNEGYDLTQVKITQYYKFFLDKIERAGLTELFKDACDSGQEYEFCEENDLLYNEYSEIIEETDREYVLPKTGKTVRYMLMHNNLIERGGKKVDSLEDLDFMSIVEMHNIREKATFTNASGEEKQAFVKMNLDELNAIDESYLRQEIKDNEAEFQTHFTLEHPEGGKPESVDILMLPAFFSPKLRG